MNVLRKKLADKKRISGTLVCLDDPCLCEIMGHAGYDLVWIDTEHSYLSYRDVLCHLNAARSVGIASMVRLPQHDLTATKKILEMRPDAILFPMVHSAEEAEELIRATLYPPHGTRGFGPMRAIRYGFDDAAQYVKQGSLEMCRFIQIEDLHLIDELKAVAQNPYVDGFIFGPNDLSGSAGDFLNVFDEVTVQPMKRAMSIARQYRKTVGIAGGMDDTSVRFWAQLDPDILICGADWNFVSTAAKDTLDRLTQYGY
ncbi:MAG: aldolase [Clostridia bacterium]|nr:aldolase [Clostridia bacterium]